MNRKIEAAGFVAWVSIVAMLAWALCAGPAPAQQTAKVVSACGSAGYTAGTTNYVTQDTTGAACGNSSGGGGGGSVTQGTSPWVDNVTQFGSSNVATGTGVGGAGIPRFTISSDSSLSILLSGAAPSLTNPIFMANAEAADTTGTFTNATQTTSVTNSAADGYAAGLISINGTYGTASGVFEVSDDSGTTWYPVICSRSDGSASETGYTSLTNTNRQWSCPVGGNDSLRVRSTAVASGTANVRVGISAPPPSSNTVAGTVTAVQPTAANFNATVVGTGTFATQSTLQAGSAIAGKFGIDQTTPGTTNGVALTQVGSTTVLTGGVAGSQGMGGLAANNASTSGNPLPTSGLAQSAEPALATNGQNAEISLDLAHKQITLPYANPENFVTSTVTVTASTADTSFIPSAGTGLVSYITSLACFNSGATATVITLKNGSGGTVFWTGYALNSGGGFTISFPTPAGGKALSTATAVYVNTGSSTSSVYCSATSYKGS